MKRFFNWVRAIFNRGMDKLEDPDVMLDQARRDMRQAFITNREKAVQAIAQKNRLQTMLDERLKASRDLETKATMALQQGNRELARQFVREKAANDAGIESLQASVAQATETVESVKLALKRQEEDIRKKTAEALQLKAQWRQAEIQSSITKALDGLTFETEYEGSFASAREKIQAKQAEASARTELNASSLQGKIMQMEDQAMDYEAESQLQELEKRLGMRDGGMAEPQVQAAPESDIEAELEKLEKRLEQGN